MVHCAICNEYIKDRKKASVLESKGCDSLTEASKKRGTTLNVTVGDLVHQDCRRQYTNPNVIKRESSAITQENFSRRHRSVDPQFSFSPNCYFCGQEATLNGKKKDVMSSQ